MSAIEIYTDGACRGNPGPGGWAALLVADGRRKEIYGGERLTTNNRMELMGAIRGLSALKRACDVTLFTDSKYVLNGITEWLADWKARGWKTSAKKPVKNQDLWELLDAVVLKHRVTWEWVRGHAGHPENERADALANVAIDEMLKQKLPAGLP